MKNNRLGNLILKTLFKNKNIISVNIVGSYSEKKNLNTVGDIDVVVICKKISKKIINKLKSDLDNLNKKKITKVKLVINSSFGPLKIKRDNYIPIHLMIYDVQSHIDHVTSSPFTCYDWERTNWYKGISLKEIYPVRNLQLNDFFNARRNSQEYLKELNKNKISIRNFKFKKQKVFLKKELVKINSKNRGEFVFHIINFLIMNLYKFIIKENLKISNAKFKDMFMKITKDKKLFNSFKKLKKNKENKTNFYSKDIIKTGKQFINKYHRYLNQIKKNSSLVVFSRHQKTLSNKKNVFLGSGSDPDIIYKKAKKISNNNFDLLITSQLKRAKNSEKYFNFKSKLTNKLLNEINYGKAEGLKFNIFKTKYPKIIKSWSRGVDVKFPNGESTSDVKRRVLKFLNYLKKLNNKKSIIIITHSFFLRVLIGVIYNFDLKKIYKINIDHLKQFEFTKIKKQFSSNIQRSDIKKFYEQIND